MNDNICDSFKIEEETGLVIYGKDKNSNPGKGKRNFERSLYLPGDRPP